MNRRPDIIVYAVSFLLLVGAASLWWQGVFPSSSRELVLLPDEQSSARHNEGPGESNHPGSSGIYDVFGDSESGNPSEPKRAEPDDSMAIFVHVAGAVKSPGVYRLVDGQRVYEALELAEPLDDADLDLLNLAGLLHDQDKIYVPKKGELSGSGEAGQGGFTSGPGHGGGGSGSRTGSGNSAFPINVNTATTRELEALPGIGPAKARAIVEFRRQRGPFSKKEDLKQVSGIGDVTYSKIEGLITIR